VETSPIIKTALPGPLAMEVLARDKAVTSPSLPRAYPLVPQRGHGASVEDVDGNVFLDFNAGIAVSSTGHSHPTIVEAVRRQAGEILHYSASDFYLPIYSEMCAALRDVAPISGSTRVYLSNSGAEAVEAALKLARCATKRPYVISFYGAFHGRTMGALTLTDSKAKYHKGFGPLLPGVLHAPYAGPRRTASGERDTATVDFLREILFRYEVDPTEVAAIFVEPIQGEGSNRSNMTPSVRRDPPTMCSTRCARLRCPHGAHLAAKTAEGGLERGLQIVGELRGCVVDLRGPFSKQRFCTALATCPSGNSTPMNKPTPRTSRTVSGSSAWSLRKPSKR